MNKKERYFRNVLNQYDKAVHIVEYHVGDLDQEFYMDLCVSVRDTAIRKFMNYNDGQVENES